MTSSHDCRPVQGSWWRSNVMKIRTAVLEGCDRTNSLDVRSQIAARSLRLKDVRGRRTDVQNVLIKSFSLALKRGEL